MTPSAGARVGAFMAAMFSAFAISGAFLSLFLSDRGLSPDRIGLVLGAASLVRVCAGPGWGVLADHFGQRRKLMALAAGLAGCAALALVPADGFLPVLLVVAWQGAAAAALSPLSDSLALALAREGRMVYGPARAAGSAAFMVASAAGGRMLAVAGTRIVPWLIAAGFGVAALIALFLPEPVRPAAGARRLSGALDLLRAEGFRRTLLASALIQGSHAAFYGFAPLFWRSQGIDDATIGLLIAEGIVAEVALFLWGRRLIERLGPSGLTACAAAAGVLRWSVTATTVFLPVLAAAQALHAVTFAFQHQSAMLVLQRAVPPERAATAQALYGALGMGAPTGALMFASGWLYGWIGGQTFFAMAALCAIALGTVRRE